MRRIILSFAPIVCAALSIATAAQTPATSWTDAASRFNRAGLHDAALDMLAPGQYDATTPHTLPGEQSNPLELDSHADAQLTRIAAAVAAADPAAPALIDDYLRRFPTTPHAQYLAILKGDCLLDAGETRRALDIYADVNIPSLNPWQQSHLGPSAAMAATALGDNEFARQSLDIVVREPYIGRKHLYLASQLYNSGDYNGALDELRHVAGGNNARTMYATALKAGCHFALKDYAPALDEATAVLEQEPGNASMQRIAGESAAHLRQWNTALQWLGRYLGCNTSTAGSSTYHTATQQTPHDRPAANDDTAWYWLGIARYNTGDYPGTTDALSKITATTDRVMLQSSLLTMGQALMAQGNHDAAIRPLKLAAVTDADPTLTEEALYNHAVATVSGGKAPFENTVPLLEKFLKKYPSSKYSGEIAEYVALAYMNQDNYDEALHNLDLIPYPTAEVLTARRQVLYMLGVRALQQGDAAAALDYFDRSLKAQGGDGHLTAETMLLRGDALYRLGRYDDSRHTYQAYLRHNDATSIPLGHYGMGYSQYALQQWQQAAASFDKAVETSNLTSTGVLPATARADACNRAGDCRYCLKDIDGAIAAYDRAAALAPAMADYPLWRRGVMLSLKGEYPAAARTIEEMTARWPQSPLVPDALVDLADVYISTDDVNRAAATYRRVTDDYPGSQAARRAMLLLGALQAARLSTADAFDTYCTLIDRYAPCDEANAAASSLEELARQEGRVGEYLTFMRSNPRYPALDTSHADALAWQAATDDASTLGYLNNNPDGQHRDEALVRLARSAASRGDWELVLSYTATLTSAYPTSSFAGEAYLLEGNALEARGETPAALEAYRRAESAATTPAGLNAALTAQLNASRDLGMDNDVIILADRLLNSSTPGAGDLSDVKFAKACALSRTGRHDEAAALWQELSADPLTLLGAKSCYYLAQALMDNGNTTAALGTVTRLTSSTTPHSYWLARGYILLSDIYHAQGKNYESVQYLQSIRDNYPGTEPDIFSMIDSRLEERRSN